MKTELLTKKARSQIVQRSALPDTAINTVVTKRVKKVDQIHAGLSQSFVKCTLCIYVLSTKQVLMCPDLRIKELFSQYVHNDNIVMNFDGLLKIGTVCLVKKKKQGMSDKRDCIFKVNPRIGKFRNTIYNC